MSAENNFKHASLKNMQLNIIITILRELNFNDLTELNEEQKEHVRVAIRDLIVKDSIQSSRINDIVEFEDVSLTYIEKKSLKQYIHKVINEKYLKLNNLTTEIGKNDPSFMTREIIDNAELLELEIKYQDRVKTLIEKKLEKMNLIKKCLDLRLSPSVQKQFDLLLLRIKTIHLSESTMGTVMASDSIKLSTYTPEAIAKVEFDMNELLNIKKE